MKILSFTIKNVGIIEDCHVEIGQPLLIFYGKICQGKTTVINAIRWCFGGAFPADIIRHSQDEASVTITTENGSITREWYRGRDGETKDRGVVFIRNGKQVAKPVGEIARLLNPFLLDQDHLVKMKEAERRAFFADIFHVDTAALDAEVESVAREASNLRATIKGYGDIDLTPVVKPDLQALRDAKTAAVIEHAGKVRRLQTELDKIGADHREIVDAIDADNADIRERNRERESCTSRIEEIDIERERLEESLRLLEDERGRRTDWLAANPSQDFKARPSAPDVSALREQISTPLNTGDLDAKLSRAQADEVRHQQYERNKARHEERQKHEKRLAALEARGRELKAEKTKKLSGISESSGIEGLLFDESGDFTYQGTSAGMLSTSQLMRLSSELSSKYPEGFSIALLDRGESLGASIFDYVKRAQERNLTILATVVSEKPADNIPDGVGVFVVTNGQVAAQK